MILIAPRKIVARILRADAKLYSVPLDSQVLPPAVEQTSAASASSCTTGSKAGSGAFQRVRELLSQAVELEGYDSDYTKVVRPLEASLGIELHNNGGTCDAGTDCYAPPKYVASEAAL